MIDESLGICDEGSCLLEVHFANRITSRDFVDVKRTRHHAGHLDLVLIINEYSEEVPVKLLDITIIYTMQEGTLTNRDSFGGSIV